MWQNTTDNCRMTAGWRRFVRSRQSWSPAAVCTRTKEWLKYDSNHSRTFFYVYFVTMLQIRTLKWAPPTHWHTWTEQSFSTSVQNTSLEQNTKAAQSITISIKQQINLVLYNWFFIKNMWSINSWDSWFIQVLIRTGNEPGRGFSHDPVLVATDSQLLLGII